MTNWIGRGFMKKFDLAKIMYKVKLHQRMRSISKQARNKLAKQAIGEQRGKVEAQADGSTGRLGDAVYTVSLSREPVHDRQARAAERRGTG